MNIKTSEMKMVRVIDENFKSFKIGNFPSDISAVGEYHFAPPKGYTGIWYEPNKDTSWITKKCWTVMEHNGNHEMEISIDNGACTTLPMLTAGEKDWHNYCLAGHVWPLALRGFFGLAFRYMDSRHFYLFALAEGRKVILYRKEEEALKVMAQVDFDYDCDHYYRLEIRVNQDTIKCSIDDKDVFILKATPYGRGQIAMVGTAPVRYSSVTLDVEKEDYFDVIEAKKIRQESLQAKRKDYPSPRLWKIIDLKDFGSSRNIRFGDLTGNGRKDFLFVQNLTNESLGDECMISCITAIDLDGKVLWQIGEPDPERGMLTADLPIQIYDIDGDGFNEVIYCKDFRIIIADGRTGKTKFCKPTPRNVPVENYKIYENVYYERIVGDSIRICNFSGNEKPSDILLKDRYNNIWAYDCELNFKWHKSVNSGHFPVSFDINGDGNDELMVGHTLLDSEGNIIWELPGMVCHVDEIVIGRFDPDNDKQLIAMVSGEDGFLLVDEDGKILVQDHMGHAQRLSAAKYRPDLPGLQYCVTTFWRNTGIIVYYDCKGNRLYSFETGANGNVVSPVNWTGDGRELILYSASTRYGGLFDGYGDPVVLFPQDNHPELCCEAIDLCGDEREELLAWDTKRMYIYTQEDCPAEVKYVPKKYDDFNYSNYRGEFSFPSWREETNAENK